jgi:hypothetical protein
MLLGMVALVAGALAARRAINDAAPRGDQPRQLANATPAPRPPR